MKNRARLGLSNFKKRFLAVKLLCLGVLALAIGVMVSNYYQPPQVAEAAGADDFVTTWRVSGDAAGRTVVIPTFKNPAIISNQPYNYTIDWGDGTAESFISSTTPRHTYASDGDYEIRIHGQFPGWSFLQGNSQVDQAELTSVAQKLITINQWGTGRFINMAYMFYGASNVEGTYSDVPDTSGLVDVNSMFRGAAKFNSPVVLNTSKVRSFQNMFEGTTAFNQPITFDGTNLTAAGYMFYKSGIASPVTITNTKNLVTVAGMFRDAPNFNHPITLDGTSLTSAATMFNNASSFNSPVVFSGTANKLENLQSMFDGATSFNQPVNFNTGLVTNMTSMFARATSFNQPINFDASSLERADLMFFEATAFNSSVTLQNSAKLKQMSGMFRKATYFNQPITFDTRSVTTMEWLFTDATSFNQPLTLNTGNVTTMRRMFERATSFNSSLSFSDLSKVTDMSIMFNGAAAFNQPINFSSTSSLANASNMFSYTATFNQPVNINTSQVTSATSMFMNATSFNQDLSGLNFSKITDKAGLTNFVSNSKLSVGNYDRLIMRWSNVFLGSSLRDVSPGVNKLKYCKAEPQRVSLASTNNWSFVGDSKDCSGVNFAPVGVSLDGSIDENNLPGVQVGTLKAVIHPDDIAGDTHTFRLTCAVPAANDGLFSIVGDKLHFNAVADYETKSSYAICVRVTDAAGEFFDQNLTVRVSNLNDAPAVTSTAVSAATKGELYEYTITATDEDGDNLTYSAIGLPDWLRFDPSTRKLSGTPGNAEAGNTYSVKLRVSDGTTHTDQDFTITVADKNYPPSIADQTFSVAENTANGTELDQIAASDPDAGQSLAYSIISGNDLGIFAVTNGGKLQIANNANLDYEAHQQVILRVRVTDNGSPVLSAEANITINITDVNEASSFTSAAHVTINEDETSEYTLTATDPENNSLSYSAENLPGWVSLSGDKITFRPRQAQVGTHNITVKVSDGTNETSQTITVTVNNVNDAPVVTSTAPTSASKGVLYEYTVEATDEDGDNLSFAAIGLPAWLQFDPTTRKLSGTPGQAEVGGNYSITIRVSDGTTHTDQTFTITVADKNYPPVIAAQTFSVAENSDNGTVVGQIVASDPDTGQGVTFSIASGNNLGIFEVTTDGKISVLDNTNLDFEKYQQIVLKVRATDNGAPNLSAEADITINLADVDEAPVVNSNPLTDISSGEYEYIISASDPENQTLVYSATTLPTWLRFDPVMRKLYGTPPALDADQEYEVVIEISDGVNVIRQEFKIMVRAANTVNPGGGNSGTENSNPETPAGSTGSGLADTGVNMLTVALASMGSILAGVMILRRQKA